jgi:uncharacterized protein (DUF433 family)
MRIEERSLITIMENIYTLPISVNPKVMGGTPVFAGTRVPVSTLFSYLEKNYSLDEFLDSFPSVSKEAAIAVLVEAEHNTLDRVVA